MTAAAQKSSEGLSPRVAAALGIDAEPLRVPPLQLWPAEGTCLVAGRRIVLSRKEFALLAGLVAAPDHIIPRERL